MKTYLIALTLLSATNALAENCVKGQLQLNYENKPVACVDLEKNSIRAEQNAAIDTVKFYKSNVEGDEVAICGQKTVAPCTKGEVTISRDIVQISSLAGTSSLSMNFEIQDLTTGRARFEITPAVLASTGDVRIVNGTLKANKVKAPAAK